MMRSDALTELDALAQGLLGTRSTPRSPQFMPVDVYRMEDRYFVHADLPGMDPGSIDVNMGRGVLTLTAHRSSLHEQEVQWLTSERFSGSYRRQITFGDDIDPDQVHLPGIYVDRIVVNASPEKRIEQRTVRPA